MGKLSDAEVTAGIQSLQGWSRRGDAIEKSYVFRKFAEGIAFVDRVAAKADAADHHPDIDIRYTTVKMVLSTHSEGGITRKDLELAREIERAAIL